MFAGPPIPRNHGNYDQKNSRKVTTARTKINCSSMAWNSLALYICMFDHMETMTPFFTAVEGPIIDGKNG